MGPGPHLGVPGRRARSHTGHSNTVEPFCRTSFSCIYWLGIRAGLLLTAVTVRFCVSPGPAVMFDQVDRRPARRVLEDRGGAGIAVSVGGWLTGVTVTVKVCGERVDAAVGEPPLSVTVTVIVAVPLALAAGVKRASPWCWGWCR